MTQFFTGRMLFLMPNSVKALKATILQCDIFHIVRYSAAAAVRGGADAADNVRRRARHL